MHVVGNATAFLEFEIRRNHILIPSLFHIKICIGCSNFVASIVQSKVTKLYTTATFHIRISFPRHSNSNALTLTSGKYAIQFALFTLSHTQARILNA